MITMSFATCTQASLYETDFALSYFAMVLLAIIAFSGRKPVKQTRLLPLNEVGLCGEAPEVSTHEETASQYERSSGRFLDGSVTAAQAGELTMEEVWRLESRAVWQSINEDTICMYMGNGPEQ